MYRYKHRTYTSNISDLSQIPFSDLVRDYEAARVRAFEYAKAAKAALVTRVREKFLAEHGLNNSEVPYEGSYEGINTDNIQVDVNSLVEKESSVIIEDFITKHSLAKKSGWLFSQGLAKFATLDLDKNENGLISAKKLYLGSIRNNELLFGCLLLFKYSKRSSLLEKQTAAERRNYCSLVPLVMSAFKRYQNIPYSKWDPLEISGITEPNLASIMLAEGLPSLGSEEIMQIRDASLTFRSGEKAGTKRSPVTTYTLYTPAGTPLSSMPMLLRIMYCQTWCAHPSVRTEYMILDPSNWDKMPEALVEGEIFKNSDENPGYTDLGAKNDLPWWL
jgi:hypothetical protein